MLLKGVQFLMSEVTLYSLDSRPAGSLSSEKWRAGGMLEDTLNPQMKTLNPCVERLTKLSKS
jgi:hypothetical protein